jgi:hypothetical protein
MIFGKGVFFLAFAVVLIAVKIALFPSVLPMAKIKSDAQKFHRTEESYPLLGKVAIVTGSTSGLGKSLATQLYEVMISPFFIVKKFTL